MGRYPKDMPAEVKQQLSKEKKRKRNRKYSLKRKIAEAEWMENPTISEEELATAKRIPLNEFIQKYLEQENRIKESKSKYYAKHREELIEKQKEKNLGKLGTTDFGKTTDIDYEFKRLGLDKYRQVTHATTKEELERARKQLGNQKKYKIKNNQAIRYTDEEEDNGFPYDDLFGIAIIFVVSFVLGVYATKHRLSLNL
jgi:hypothetical protein